MADRVSTALDIVLHNCLEHPRSPLVRPSVRYSTLLKLSLLSRSMHSVVKPILYSHVFISEGNRQLSRLLSTLRSHETLAKEVKQLSLVSRHHEHKHWNVDEVQQLVSLCSEVRNLVVAIPTSFGVKADFLSSNSLARLESLTLATPVRPHLSLSNFKPPCFTLSSLSLLPPFDGSFSISFKSTFDSLLSIRKDGTTSLSSLVHLNLSDSRHLPLVLPPQLGPTICHTLETLLLPRFTHSHSYSLPLPRPDVRRETRYSCDDPTNLHHPSRQLVDSCTSLRRVYVPSLGHVGAIHHLARAVQSLVIGPSSFEEVGRDKEKLEELKNCLINTNARLREVGVLLKRGSRLDEREGTKARVGRELKAMIEEVEGKKRGCRVEVCWV